MKYTRHTLFVLIATGLCLWLFWPEPLSINPALPISSRDAAEARTLQAPEAFHIGVFARNIRGVRMLQTTPAGDVIASQPDEGRVVLLRRDQNNDGQTDGLVTLVDGLNQPHGIGLHLGWLYIAETDAVIRIRFDAASAETSGSIETLVRGYFPGGSGHWTRSLGIGPDQHLYVSVGSSCNVCIEKQPTRAAMLRFQLDGSEAEIFARGLRNTVGFDWHPESGKLYGTDNGRDWLGDNFPPCELNHIEQGLHYGWPFANGMNIPDPDYGQQNPQLVANSIPPVHNFAAHNAPLGIKFIRHQTLPDDYQNSALVALHGSWNRSKKDGYKVVSLHFQSDGTIEERNFITGFLDGERVRGRPVDIAQDREGTIFISDDHSGQVYRVRPRSSELE